MLTNIYRLRNKKEEVTQKRRSKPSKMKRGVKKRLRLFVGPWKGVTCLYLTQLYSRQLVMTLQLFDCSFKFSSLNICNSCPDKEPFSHLTVMASVLIHSRGCTSEDPLELLKNCLFIWLLCVFIAVCGLSLVAESWGYSLVAVCGLFTGVTSLAVEHGLQGTQASVVAVHGLSCSACGIFLYQRSNPCPWHW